MSEETTRNFWDVMQSFQWPEPEPISFRLYHDDNGKPLIYTMEHLPGAYIEVDADTYTRASHNVRVRDGRLILLEPAIRVSRLVKDPDNGMACDPRDVCVVVDALQSHEKWKTKTNDID